jgi:hypothetical protein
LTDASFSSDHERTGFIGQLLHSDSLKWYESLVRVGYEPLYKYNTFLHKLPDQGEFKNCTPSTRSYSYFLLHRSIPLPSLGGRTL